MRRALRSLLALGGAAALAAAGWFAWFASRPLEPPRVPYDFTVKPGTSLKSLARTLADQGLLAEPHSFWILGRVMGKAGSIHAGTYRIDRALRPVDLLDKLSRGEVLLFEIAFVEGTTLRQWFAQIATSPDIRQTLAGKDDAELVALFGIDARSPEGWFFPDTYRFAPGSADADILRRAHAAMKRQLAQAWEARDPGVPLATPYEALILASIVEKETAVAEERPLVASVFANRLRKGMRLQTDPTVIYGMGEGFDGNIRRKDLSADTPWNTYTRDGLPPTPIAMPGAAALMAAVKPAQSAYLYFVSRGDGSHEFSRTLDEHNRAVARYQLRRATASTARANSP